MRDERTGPIDRRLSILATLAPCVSTIIDSGVTQYVQVGHSPQSSKNTSNYKHLPYFQSRRKSES